MERLILPVAAFLALFSAATYTAVQQIIQALFG